MNNLVSVVIPTYNSSAYVAESVRSVLEQSYSELEVVLVDDGSTDNTRQVAEDFRDARVRYSPMDKRRGNYFARNHGISLANGDFIAFLDADDLWSKDKLRKQMDIFGLHPEIGACFTDHHIFEDGAPEKHFYDAINTYPDDGHDQKKFIRRLLTGNFLITSSAVVRRDCFKKVGVFDTAYQNAMDYDMWLRIILNYRAAYLTDRLVFRRIHPSNISRNRVNTMAADKYTFEKLLSEKAGHIFFEPEYGSVAENRIQELLYYLGLEYLMAGDFDNSVKNLEICRLPGKRLFRALALMAARTHSRLLLKAIQSYRRKKQASIVVPAASL